MSWFNIVLDYFFDYLSVRNRLSHLPTNISIRSMGKRSTFQVTEESALIDWFMK